MSFQFENGIFIVANIQKKEGGILTASDKLKPSDLAGIYKDIAEIIGLEATLRLHKDFQGQQITLPKKLYTKSYILQQTLQNGKQMNIKAIAKKYGYTERRLRQMIKENVACLPGKQSE
ncbi:hypothetical protein HNQ56_003806 [Anaerotaenia torta]|uniref:Mor transcription activator family protein n=1 Tax=Anaerotaenia torta TaxID=433293 RepID=UPI003D253C93